MQNAQMKSTPITDEIVIQLPDPRLFRLIARSALLAAAILSLPWLRSAFLPDPEEILTQGSDQTSDELFYMPKLLQDMKSHGLILPHSRSVFLGNPGLHSDLLRQNGVDCLPEPKIYQIGRILSPQSLDFVFLIAGGLDDALFHVMDPVIRVGGIAAFQIGTHPVKPFALPANYRMIYIQNIGRTIVAVKKLYHEDARPPGKLARRLLSSTFFSEAKEEALQALEDALLEPPVVDKHRSRIRYLPELIGEALDKFPRRVFVDIGSPGRSGAEDWFRKKYPRKNKEFEMVRVDLVDRTEQEAAGDGDVGIWLRKSVRKEDYVVVKAEAEAVEEMVNRGVVELVDELFLECGREEEGEEEEEDEEEEEGKWKRGRAYWECLVLFGKLREKGVAVHQWWG